ncbi:MAG: TonB-dependent receptor [Bacteroidota bacterium]
MKRRFGALYILVFLFPCLLLAQGKIKGIVVDKVTAEPLVGANVVLEGTTLGAASSPEGEFILSHVPVGVYALRATYIGYAQFTLQNVRVNYQLTTEVTLELTPEEIDLEPVVIFALRPLINKSSTNAVRITTSEEIDAVPIRGLDQILALQPGVVAQDGNIYIRGGRHDEVGYYLEGAYITDAQYGGRGLTLVQDALEEVSIQSAGYEAEFGRANAGIIQHQLKTGGASWRASIEFLTDNITFSGKGQRNSGSKRAGAYWFGYNEFIGALGGPLFDERFKFFGVFNYLYLGDRHPQPYPGVEIGPVKDPFSGDSINLVYPAGPILKNSDERYTITSTLTADFRPVLLRLSGSYAHTKSFLGSYPQDMFNLDRVPEGRTEDGFASLKATYFLGTRTFIELSGGYFQYHYKEFDPVLGEDFVSYGDSVANAANAFIWNRGPMDPTGRFERPASKSIYGYAFTAPGYPLAGGLLKLERGNITLGAALATQIGSHHSLKAGGDYQRFTIRTYQIGSLRLARTIHENNLLPDASPQKQTLEDIFIANVVNNYGYDVFGNIINTDDFLGPRHPVFASAYLQDKMEYGDLVINLGLRYDYINTGSFPLIDPTRPELAFDKNTVAVNPEGLGKSTPFHGLSPRLGIAFPVTDRTVFHLQFAKLVQQSRLRNVHLGLYSVADALRWGGYGHPVGWDLRPSQTVQFEIGFTQQLGEHLSFDLTGYYKDTKDEITMRQLTPAQGSPFGPYAVYANGDFATIKGMELLFRMRRLNRLLAGASLSFQDARGSGSFPNSNRGIVLSGSNILFIPHYITPLNYNHAVRGNVNVDYRFGRDDGGPILQELGLSLLLTFHSGHPFTRQELNSAAPTGPLNSSTTPWAFQTDLRFDKTFRFTNRLSATLFLYVINLFDAKNVENVWPKTGSANDDGWLSNPSAGGKDVETFGPIYAEIYRSLSVDYRRLGGAFNIDPYFYGPPRQIRLGIRIQY